MPSLSLSLSAEFLLDDSLFSDLYSDSRIVHSFPLRTQKRPEEYDFDPVFYGDKEDEAKWVKAYAKILVNESAQIKL